MAIHDIPHKLLKRIKPFILGEYRWCIYCQPAEARKLYNYGLTGLNNHDIQYRLNSRTNVPTWYYFQVSTEQQRYLKEQLRV